tara:strand:+ start:13029 stop:16457 length:3429 start_codon:yes stop_codon:yes gene_type:complete
MPEQVIKAGRIKREKQRFYLGNEEITGVQNVTLSYQSNIAPVKHVGMHGKSLITTFQGPQQGEASVASYLISEDPIIEYTGDKPVNGYLIKDISGVEDNFSFVSGYLTSYEASFSINQIPQINGSFQVFGDVGNISVNKFNSVSGDLGFVASGDQQNEIDFKVSSPGTLEVCFDDKETNRLQSIDLSINCSRSPVYALGNRYPIEVNQNYPIEINCDFTFDLNDYQATNLRDEVCNPTIKNLYIKAKDYESSETIAEYCFENLYKVSEQQTINESSEAQIRIGYKGWIFDTTTSEIPAIFCPANVTGERNDTYGPLEFFVTDDTSFCCIDVTGYSLNTGLIPDSGIQIVSPNGSDSTLRHVYVQPLHDTTGCGEVRLVANDGYTSGYCDFQICNFDLKPIISEISNETIHVLGEVGITPFTVTHENPDFNLTGITVTARSESDLIVPDINIHVTGYSGDFSYNVTGDYQTGEAKFIITADDGNFFDEEFFFVTVINDPPTVTNVTSASGLSMNTSATGEVFQVSVADTEVDFSGITLGAYSLNDDAIDSNTGIIIEGTGEYRWLHLFRNQLSCAELNPVIVSVANDGISSGTQGFLVSMLNEPPELNGFFNNVIISNNLDTGTGFGFSVDDDYLAIGDVTIVTGIDIVDSDAQDIPDIFLFGAGENKSIIIDPKTSNGTGIFDFTYTASDHCESSSEVIRIEVNEVEQTGSIASMDWAFDELGFEGDLQAGNYRSYVGQPDLGRNSPWTFITDNRNVKLDFEDSADTAQGSDGCGGGNANIQTANATGVFEVEDAPVLLTAVWAGLGEIHSPLSPDQNFFGTPTDFTFERGLLTVDNVFIGAGRAPGGSQGKYGCCPPNTLDCNGPIVSMPNNQAQQYYLDVGPHTGVINLSTIDNLFHKECFYQVNFNWRHPKTKVAFENSWNFTDEGLMYWQDVEFDNVENHGREYIYSNDSGKFYTGDFSRNTTTKQWELDIGGDAEEMSEEFTGIPFSVSGDESFFGMRYDFEAGNTCGDSPSALVYNEQNQFFSAEHEFVLDDERNFQIYPNSFLTEYNTSGELAVCHLNGTGVCWLYSRDVNLQSCTQVDGNIEWNNEFDNGFFDGLTPGVYTILITGSAEKQSITPSVTQPGLGDFVDFNFRISR